MHDRIAHIEKQLAAAVDLNTQRGALLYLTARPSLQGFISEDEAINAYARVINANTGMYENVAAIVFVGSLIVSMFALCNQYWILLIISLAGLCCCALIAKAFVSNCVAQELDEAFQAIAAVNRNRGPAALANRQAPALPMPTRYGRPSVAADFDVPPQR